MSCTHATDPDQPTTDRHGVDYGRPGTERVLADLYRPAASTFEEAFARWRADGAPDVPPEVDTALRFAQAEACTGGRACSSVVHVEGCFSEAWSDDEIKRCVWSLAELARRDGPACLTPCEDCRDEAPAAADGDVS